MNVPTSFEEAKASARKALLSGCPHQFRSLVAICGHPDAALDALTELRQVGAVENITPHTAPATWQRVG